MHTRIYLYHFSTNQRLKTDLDQEEDTNEKHIYADVNAALSDTNGDPVITPAMNTDYSDAHSIPTRSVGHQNMLVALRTMGPSVN